VNQDSLSVKLDSHVKAPFRATVGFSLVSS